MISDYESAVRFLLGRVNYETFRQIPYEQMRQNLNRLKQFLAFLGRPDRRFPIVHVAGTKGKGSVCAMLDAIAVASGLRVGRFTSPHLYSLNERFTIDGVPCPNCRVIEIVQSLEKEWTRFAKKQSTPQELTFFEWSTVFAFAYFAQEQVDLGVVEVGLGGRFDATNVCQPTIGVIVGVSLEHTEQLGHTLAAIAGEKAGIIKPHIPIVGGVEFCEGDDPRRVVRQTAAEQQALLFEKQRDFSLDKHSDGAFDFLWNPVAERDLTQSSAPVRIERLRLKLLGEHQKQNAAVALAAIMLLRRSGFVIADENIRRALATLEIPGRVELRQWQTSDSSVAIILDGSHNRASAEALLESLQTLNAERRFSRKILLFGSALGKDVVGMFETLLPFFDRVILSQCTSNPRAFPAKQLQETAKNVASMQKIRLPPQIEMIPAISDALQDLRSTAEKNSLICVTGSLYFMAEAGKICNGDIS
ncbi:MAG: bifunctional folylpolyglutamate synthase/dihydrofolate synthase [Planctomycetaceae bacterium]|jgi:dihydrofolate synthase/folylpolyglutamate synthase|nr:bifunctional folylpolyglutamate synthase/dihydrofolate synthase [Planctomycetaceae bacterium]